MARPVNHAIKKAIDEAIQPFVEERKDAGSIDNAASGSGDGWEGVGAMIVSGGLAPLLCWLKFIGYSDLQASKRLGVNHNTVTRFCKTPYFERIYAEQRNTMLERVDQHFRERLQEEVLRSVNTLTEIRDDPKTRRDTRVKAAEAMIGLYEKFVGAGKGAPSNILERLRTLTTTRRDDGKIEKVERTTLTLRERAPVDEVSEADDAEGSGGGAGDLGAGGSANRGEGAGQVAGGPG